MIAIIRSRHNSRRGRQRQDQDLTPLYFYHVAVISVVFIIAPVVALATVQSPSSVHRQSAAAAAAAAARVAHRSLQSTSTIPDLTSLFTNGTDCPADCPLCKCALLPATTMTNSSTNTTSENDVESCIYTKSIEACASGSLQKCYAGLLPMNFDIEGLCSVQCATTTTPSSTSQQQQGGTTTAAATICRICDIFSCCNNCPAGDVGQCFPPMSSDSHGYTPVGWKPLSCQGGEGSTSGGRRDSTGSDVLWRFGLVGVTAWLTWLL